MGATGQEELGLKPTICAFSPIYFQTPICPSVESISSRAKRPVIRMGRQSVLLIVGFVMISCVSCQDALDNLEPAARLKCYECATDGCVTEEDLGVEKECKAEAQVCFVGVGGGKVYRKCGIEQETRAECVDTTDNTGEPLTACYCHGDLCNSSRQLTTTSWLLTVAILGSLLVSLK